MRCKWRRFRPWFEELEPRVVPSAYYVAPTGSDGGNGSSAAPWKTLQHAADVVVAGDTVNVAAGQYQGFIMNDTSRQGTASSYIRFLAQPGAQITTQNADGSGIEVFQVGYVDLEGFTVSGITGNGTSTAVSGYGIAYRDAPGGIIRDNTVENSNSVGIYTGHADNVLVEGNTSYGSVNSHGLYISNTTYNPVVRGNLLYNNAKAGIHLNGDASNPPGDGLVHNALIEDNIIHDNGLPNGSSGIDGDGVVNSTIENNLLYNNHAGGIALFQIDAGAPSTNNVIVNNTVVMASDGRSAISISDGSTGNKVYNNILYSANPNEGSISVDLNSLGGFVSDYNAVQSQLVLDGSLVSFASWRSQTGQDAHSFASTPSALFVNASANNYHLSATSQAIDAGTATDAPSTDLDGNARPQGNGYDIGAYEYVSSAPAVTHLGVSAPPGATAGASFSITVTALDASNNPVPGYKGKVHFTSTDGQAALPGDYTFTAADAGSHTFTVTLATAGSETVTATDVANNSLTGQASATVTATAASSLVVAGYPSPDTAGASHTFTVTAQDAYGNTATAYAGTVHFTSTDGQAGLPADYTFGAGDAGTHTFSATLKTAGSEKLTATDTAASSRTGQETITVNPAAASSLVLSGYPSATTAGASHSFTLTAQDAYGNTATGYAGTAHFTSTDGQAALPGDYTFAVGDAGSHAFSATLKTAGSQTLTAKDTAAASLTAQASAAVSPGAAGAFLITGYPSATTAGASHSFTVTAQDAYGNTATGYAGTVHFTSSDAQAVLPGNYVFTATDAGVHAFSATLKTAGSQTLAASDTAKGSLTGQASSTVTPAAASSLVLGGYPSPDVVGASHAFTVTVKDPYGNTATGYAGTAHFASSDARAVLPADYTFTAADAGSHTFSATFQTTGAQTLTGKDTAAAALTAQVSITVNAAPPTPSPDPGPGALPAPAPAGVTDVSGLITVLFAAAGGRGRRRLERAMIINVGAGPIRGPLALVLDHLGRRVGLLSRMGITGAHAPFACPYQDVFPAGGVLEPGQGVVALLTLSSPSGRTPQFSWHVWAGDGPR